MGTKTVTIRTETIAAQEATATRGRTMTKPALIPIYQLTKRKKILTGSFPTSSVNASMRISDGV